MNDYRCEGCNGHIIDGQPVVLKTTVLSVQRQWLGESAIYHEGCYPQAPTTAVAEDLQYAVYEFGHEHWQNCDLTAEDCYQCAGYENLRDKYPNKG